MTFPADKNTLLLHRVMFRPSTVGNQTFNISAPHIWNGLPKDVVSAPTLLSFRRRLKPFLFQQSYPDIVI